jgi:hypothetical protein
VPTAARQPAEQRDQFAWAMAAGLLIDLLQMQTRRTDPDATLARRLDTVQSLDAGTIPGGDLNDMKPTIGRVVLLIAP